MLYLLKSILALCFFQKGPDDMPGFSTALIFSLILYWLVIFMAGLLIDDLIMESLRGAVELLIMTVFTQFALQIREKQSQRLYKNRFLQTMVALIGSSFILEIIRLIITVNIDIDAKTLPLLALIALILLVIWSVALIIYIYRIALDLDDLTAALVAFLYIFIDVFIFYGLFPDTTGS